MFYLLLFSVFVSSTVDAAKPKYPMTVPHRQAAGHRHMMEIDNQGGYKLFTTVAVAFISGDVLFANANKSTGSIMFQSPVTQMYTDKYFLMQADFYAYKRKTALSCKRKKCKCTPVQFRGSRLVYYKEDLVRGTMESKLVGTYFEGTGEVVFFDHNKGRAKMFGDVDNMREDDLQKMEYVCYEPHEYL